MNDNDAEVSGALTLIPAGAVEAMERASIDVQIATAHRYPRSLQRFKETAMDMVTQDEETAASCLYSRPVGDGKFAEGMSIRMAEIVSGAYGNLRVGAMLTEQTPRQVKARGFALDLESNFAATSEVIESTVTKHGQPFSERMRIVVAKACLAKALRDATFKVVPRALCKSLEDAARKTAIGDAATLEKRRGSVMDWIGKLGIDKARVFKALAVEGPADIGLKELEILTGLKTAIKEGDTSIEEAFPILKANGTKETGSKSEQLAEKLKNTTTAKEPDKPKDGADDLTLIKEVQTLVDAAKAAQIKKASEEAGWKWDEDEPLEALSRSTLLKIKVALTKAMEANK